MFSGENCKNGTFFTKNCYNGTHLKKLHPMAPFQSHLPLYPFYKISHLHLHLQPQIFNPKSEKFTPFLITFIFIFKKEKNQQEKNLALVNLPSSAPRRASCHLSVQFPLHQREVKFFHVFCINSNNSIKLICIGLNRVLRRWGEDLGI